MKNAEAVVRYAGRLRRHQPTVRVRAPSRDQMMKEVGSGMIWPNVRLPTIGDQCPSRRDRAADPGSGKGQAGGHRSVRRVPWPVDVGCAG